ncbi:hypothetical protein QN277_002808 [Acacia crassicarpa]|uniref:Uncharacterized protein n=1 Tax=Acacia crassicarpa TaxID=499986 RepID=A0AAE1TIG7_9FABA|nr:hypothetical protein QN277_002808 [Acacia crassicarpa]
MRSRFNLVFLLAALILVLHAKADESESAGLKTEPGVEPHYETDKTSDHPVSGAAEPSQAAEAPEIRRLGKHHSTDNSMAGGGVIIGGLVTASFAAVFCYIRVTRRRDAAH